MPAPRKQDAVTGKTVYGLTDTGTFKQEFIHNCPNNVYIKFNSFNDTWTFEYEHHLGIHKRKKNLIKKKGTTYFQTSKVLKTETRVEDFHSSPV